MLDLLKKIDRNSNAPASEIHNHNNNQIFTGKEFDLLSIIV